MFKHERDSAIRMVTGFDASLRRVKAPHLNRPVDPNRHNQTAQAAAPYPKRGCWTLDDVAAGLTAMGSQYFRRAGEKFPGKKGMLDLDDLTDAINHGKFPMPIEGWEEKL